MMIAIVLYYQCINPPSYSDLDPRSWEHQVNSYSEYEDAAVLSQDSLDCLDWAPENGCHDSPTTEFDHEEILQIDPDHDV